jgi:hypothetical protein
MFGERNTVAVVCGAQTPSEAVLLALTHNAGVKMRCRCVESSWQYTI